MASIILFPTYFGTAFSKLVSPTIKQDSKTITDAHWYAKHKHCSEANQPTPFGIIFRKTFHHVHFCLLSPKYWLISNANVTK